MAHPQASQELALYNGVSNRSRGWKSRKPGESLGAQPMHHTGVKTWDSSTKTAVVWDGMRSDPELWFRNGNCFVHLYARGQSRRGPAFKLPLATMLAAQCHPLVERFIAREMPSVPDGPGMQNSGAFQALPPPPPLATLDYWSRAHLLGRVDLYIPAPPDADNEQTFLYYLAIRNLFAWIFRRPVMGEHLGSALAGLYSAMCEFRHPNVDNVQDLLCYLEDDGYLAMACHPDNSLAILHLAETMRFRHLYVDAFAHCVGMYNDLYLGMEYQRISSVSRKLIRRARIDMDLRLGSAGVMLRNFLEDELSETHLELPAPARAHLDRFRTFVRSFYATRLGYYPPVSLDLRSTIFEPRVYQALAEDFQALYEYLVDESFTATSTDHTLAEDGICARQSVKAFDERCKYPPLQHPLPLLPAVISYPQGVAHGGLAASGHARDSKRKPLIASRRIPWLGGNAVHRLLRSRPDKLKPDARLVANAELLKATNKARADLCRNEFVCAYQQFEEDSVFKPYKADRAEKISMIDARKVRWIFVYAVHQTLRNCFLPPPPEVNGAGAVPYHLSISAEHISLWDGENRQTAQQPLMLPHVSLTSHTSLTPIMGGPATPNSDYGFHSSNDDNNSYYDNFTPPTRSMSMTAVSEASRHRSMNGMIGERGRTVSPVFDIQPDIDYLGLARRAETMPRDGEVEVVMLPRSRSLSRRLSQNAAFRRSLSLFRGNSGNGNTEEAMQALTRLQKGRQTEPSENPGEEVPALSVATKQESPPPRSPARPSRGRRSPPYHEIVVHGYGNGTNPVCLAVSPDAGKADNAGNEADAPDAPDAANTGSVGSQGENTKSDDVDGELGDSATTPSTSRSLSTSSTNSNTSTETAESGTTALTELSQRSSIVCTDDSISPSDGTESGAAAALESTVAVPSPSRSSSVYSNAGPEETPKPSTIPALAAGSESFGPPPSIPPRGRPRILPVHSSPAISRSSSVYSTASPAESMHGPPDTGAATGLARSASLSSTSSSRKTPPPPPVPARSSARYRRFSVYGGGDEYARATPLTTTHQGSSSSRFVAVVPEAKRQPFLLQQQQPGRYGVDGSPRRPLSLYQPLQPYQYPQHPQHPHPHRYQRLDMVQEALQVVRETMEQHHMAVPPGPGAPVSRTPSFVGVASLRSVKEDEELTMRVAGLRPHSASVRPGSRPGSRHGLGGGMRDDVQPEWEKFAVGLGGHTAL